MEMICNWINGEFSQSASGETLSCVDPSIGKEYARIPSSDEKDVAKAVEAAQKAFPAWKAKSAEERARLLRKLSQKILDNLEKLARAESIDSGKPYKLARDLEIPRAARNFEYFADAITQFSGESYAMADGKINYTVRDPLGVVAVISPWNLPLYLFTWKIAPALAAGNCVVAKPSEVTPMTAYLLSELAASELPLGVLNVVHGLGSKVGSALSKHPAIKAISFTGSTVTGAQISRDTAGTFKKLSLEMGGKNPFIVFPDVDLDRVTSEAVRAGFSNTGQICLCGSRILVHKSIYPAFRDLLVKKVKALKVGDPLEESSQQGALVSQAHFEKVSAMVKKAQQEGGQILTGGAPAKVSGRCAGGYFYEPTVIEGLPGHCSTNQEEIFGPVVTLIPFADENEAIALANGTNYGLSASVWTKDISTAHRVSARLESGVVWVNTWMLRDLRTPFGGVKNSGVGREGGYDGFRFFTEVKNICIDSADVTRSL